MCKYFTIISFLVLCIQPLVLAQDSIEEGIISPEARERYIQRALQLRESGDYTSAISEVDSILSGKSDDAAALLLKGDLLAQARQFEEAVSIYKLLLPLNYKRTISQVNLSYALFMIHKPKKALGYAETAWTEDPENIMAIVNYFNALLWNIKTKEAANFLSDQDSILRKDQYLVMSARLYSTNGKTRNGLDYYETLIQSYPEKFYVMEYVEVLLSKKEIKKSLNILDTFKSLLSENEYSLLNKKILSSEVQYLSTELLLFRDADQNSRIENTISWQQKEGLRYGLGVRAGVATLTSKNMDKTRSINVGFNIKANLSPVWKGYTDINIQNISFDGEDQFRSVTGRQSFQYQPSDRSMFGFYYSSDILNHTASLLKKNIRNHQLGYITHIMPTGKMGIFLQGNLGLVSDGNRKYQIDASFYKILKTKPLLKAGVNLSALSFKDNSITSYFSPNKYLNSEVFAEFNSPIARFPRVNLTTQGAFGMQYIDEMGWNPAFRLQTELSYSFNNFVASLKYQNSNVVSGNGTGYRFNCFAFRLVFKW